MIPHPAREIIALFLLTPLCEGRPDPMTEYRQFTNFYSRPSARGDGFLRYNLRRLGLFLLTPLCEGRPLIPLPVPAPLRHFYSRPSARGD